MKHFLSCEGTIEELLKRLDSLPKSCKYKIIVTGNDINYSFKKEDILAFGLFPQLQEISENDIKKAEWGNEDVDLL